MGATAPGGEREERRWRYKRRFMMLITVVLVMRTMFVASAAPAMAFTIRDFTDCCRVSPPTVCNTVAGVAQFEWRAGGTVCWLDAPAWELVQDTQDLEAG